MTPKQYLGQALALKIKYQRALEDVTQIRALAESAGAIRYDKVNIQSSPDNDQMANYMIRLDKAESKAVRLSEQYFEKYILIRQQIEQISPQIYSDILYLRYIHGLKLWKIADELNYDYDWLKHLHGRALTEFGKVFADQLKEHTKTHFEV